MSRKSKQPRQTPETNWYTERTLADAETDALETEEIGDETGTRCACGSEEFLLEAYLHVVGGVPKPEPVDVETLTCPECGREYEAIQAEGGKVLRGDFLGYADLDED